MIQSGYVPEWTFSNSKGANMTKTITFPAPFTTNNISISLRLSQIVSDALQNATAYTVTQTATSFSVTVFVYGSTNYDLYWTAFGY